MSELEATPSEPVLPPPWRKNLALFLATVASVFVTGTQYAESESALSRAGVVAGLQFAGTVLTILVAHELGHYVAARLHRVEASLPFFIPLPLLSPFGTMGAVIRMPGAIPTRRALLDIGAAGPLAGLVFALPLYAWGAAHSRVVPIAQEGTFSGHDHAGFGPEPVLHLGERMPDEVAVETCERMHDAEIVRGSGVVGFR